MTPARWRKIEELYDAALPLDAAARAALLESADPESRSLVERMLSNKGDESLDLMAASALFDTKSMAPHLDFGPYRLGGLIGAGGMGAVYSAVDTRLNRTVAIKIAAAQYSDRFRREARAISTLNHPHICTLYDVGPDYLVMEFIEGATLSAEIRKGPLAPELVVRYGAQIAGALEEAHARGIIHRDLKPGNIMITRHGVKLLDFGLARMVSDAALTETRAVMGTPSYMAPEQVEGREATAATDLFALGLVLYEMSTGHLPAPGASLGQMLSRGSRPTVDPLPRLNDLVTRLLEKDPKARPASAAVVAAELAAIEAPVARRKIRPGLLIPAIILFVAVGAIGAWVLHRSSQKQWLEAEAIPGIDRIASERPLAAFLLLQKALTVAPGDPRLAQRFRSLTRVSSVDSTPPGARVEIQDYATQDGPWFPVGVTPVKDTRIPNGYFRWKVSGVSGAPFVAAPETSARIAFNLPREGETRTAPVPAGRFGVGIGFIGWLSENLPAYEIDRYEVTNGEYQKFVDAGGYRNPQFWREPFVKDGTALSWDQAMEFFRDPTGRPGPSVWEGGHYPQGRESFPVSGISWYEASAYAAWAGKSLPAVLQWFQAVPYDTIVHRINQSNFDSRGPVAVTSSGGVGPFGTFGMIGNVREWCLNSSHENKRFILGGAWRTQTYQAYLPEALDPFDRSELNGFRCVRNREPLPPGAVGPIVHQVRDFSKARPVSDEVFHAYQLMYAYDHTPVDARPAQAAVKTPDWTVESVTIDAGYGNERLPVKVFIPANTRPPYQAVVFFPSARVNMAPSSENLGDVNFFDYVVQSGRLVVYPIYEGTYERVHGRKAPGAIDSLQRVIRNSKEVRRAVDYLETRGDVNKSAIAYLGVSQGSGEGVMYTALEDRFKTALLLDGGFFMCNCVGGLDQVNFAPRVKMPVLMVNGRYDFMFPMKESQESLFRMLGTPAGDKRLVDFETPHDVSQQKSRLSQEVLGWLDKYLGRIN
jgi:predicted Ser/Thr protein kinase/predicted esterase